jgi:hypothetical protein
VVSHTSYVGRPKIYKLFATKSHGACGISLQAQKSMGDISSMERSMIVVAQSLADWNSSLKCPI